VFVEVRDGRWVGLWSCVSPRKRTLEDCRRPTLVDLRMKRWLTPLIALQQRRK
jgi:hypothetical protein